MEILPPMPRYDALHPIVVHFPIALLMVAPVFIVLAMCLKKQAKAMLLSGLVLVLIGTGFAFLATSTGEAADGFVPDVPGASETLGKHEDLAELARNLFSGVSLLLALLTAFVWIRDTKLKHGHLVIMCIVMLLIYAWPTVVLINAGHEGGRLVHEFGTHAPVPKEGYKGEAENKPAEKPPVSVRVKAGKVFNGLEEMAEAIPLDVLPPTRAESMTNVQQEVLNNWVKENLVGRQVMLRGTFKNANAELYKNEYVVVDIHAPRLASMGTKGVMAEVKLFAPIEQIKLISNYAKEDSIEVKGTIKSAWLYFGPVGNKDLRNRIAISNMQMEGEVVPEGKK